MFVFNEAGGMAASTVSAASDQNNSQRAFKEKTLGGDGEEHTEHDSANRWK